jgi:hypothetical protein
MLVVTADLAKLCALQCLEWCLLACLSEYKHYCMLAAMQVNRNATRLCRSIVDAACVANSKPAACVVDAMDAACATSAVNITMSWMVPSCMPVEYAACCMLAAMQVNRNATRLCRSIVDAACVAKSTPAACVVDAMDAAQAAAQGGSQAAAAAGPASNSGVIAGAVVAGRT